MIDEVFDAEAARAAAEAGMDMAASANRVQNWKIAADNWLSSQAKGSTFIADDLVAAIGLPDPTHGVARNNVVGAWISGKVKRGILEFNNKYRKSARPVRHANLFREWRIK